MHQTGEMGGVIRSYQQVQVICHQTHRIQPMWHLGLCLGEHCQQHIPSQALGNQKLAAIASQGDVKGIPLWQLAWWAGQCF